MQLPVLPGHNVAHTDLADLIEGSAPAAAERLRRLRDLHTASYAVLRDLYRQAELRETRLQAEARIRHLKAPPSGIAVRDERWRFKMRRKRSIVPRPK
jgi:hypothetical protein